MPLGQSRLQIRILQLLQKSGNASEPELIEDGLTENREALLFDKPSFSVVFGGPKYRPLQANGVQLVLSDFSSIQAHMPHYYV